LTILLENVRGYDVRIENQGGGISRLIRSQTSLLFDVTGYHTQNIRVSFPNPREEFDFFFFGDTHGVFEHLRQIIHDANLLDPLFVMSNGDMTHSGRLEEYHELADIFGASNVPIFTSLGNHDKRARGSRATYRTMLAPLYYAFDLHNTRFIVLDSSRKRGLQKSQYLWLERELQGAQGKRIFVFLHRPPICPRYNYLSFSATTNVKRFLTMMDQYQVEMVFGSHIHVLTEFRRENVRYVVTGGGGGALWRPSNVHHYLHVFVKKEGVDIQVRELPTPEAKISQRLKDAIKFNVEFHVHKNRMLKHITILGTTLLLSRSARSEHWRRQIWKY
jgi:Icc protein